MQAPDKPRDDKVSGFDQRGRDERKRCCKEPNEDEADAIPW